MEAENAGLLPGIELKLAEPDPEDAALDNGATIPGDAAAEGEAFGFAGEVATVLVARLAGALGAAVDFSGALEGAAAGL